MVQKTTTRFRDIYEKKKDMDSFDESKNEEETHPCPMTYHEEKQVINLTSKFIYNELFHIYKKVRQGFK